MKKLQKAFFINFIFLLSCMSLSAKSPYRFLDFNIEKTSENKTAFFKIENTSSKTISSFEISFSVCTQEQIDSYEFAGEFLFQVVEKIEPAQSKEIKVVLDFSFIEETEETFYIENLHLRRVFFTDKTCWKDLTGAYSEYR